MQKVEFFTYLSPSLSPLSLCAYYHLVKLAQLLF